MNRSQADSQPRILFLDDDGRRASAFLGEYPGAIWVETARLCIDRLDAEPWDEVSLDHDLGGAENGMDVVRWLCEAPRPHLAETFFRVHTRDRPSAGAMVERLRQGGFRAEAIPYGSIRQVASKIGGRVDDRENPKAKGQPIASAIEALTIAMACLAPWAFGAVDAWAELALEIGVALLAVLGLFARDRGERARNALSAPSLAIGGLALLAIVQATPLPAWASRSIRDGLAPATPQSVVGDPGPPVSAPLRTLSLDPEASRRVAAELSSAWILFQATIGLGRGYGALRRFGVALTINGAALALFSIAQALAWDEKIYGFRPSPIHDGWYSGGPFVCHNHLAASLNLALGFAVGLLLGRCRSAKLGFAARAWQVYAAALIAAGVLASHSRGGFLAMMAASALVLGLSRAGSKGSKAAMGAVGVTVGVFLVAIGATSPIDRIGTIVGSASSGFNGRAEVWSAAWRAWAIDPVLGSGLGSFATATAPYFDKNRGVYFSHAEDEFLQILVEGGIIGLGLGIFGLASIARLARLALTRAPSSRDRAAVLGGMFGGVALAVQCLGDFPMHIPGIGVAAVVLCGHLCRLGLAARSAPSEIVSSQIRRSDRVGILVGLATVAVAAVVVDQGRAWAIAEAEVVEAGLPRPDAEMVGLGWPGAKVDLDRARPALEHALIYRPDWSEGHLRLGLVHLALYERSAADWLRGAGLDEVSAAVLADPLRLHRAVHAGSASVETHEPVRLHLLPAARAFLEARRCRPAWATPHAAIAGLDFLIAEGETAPEHAALAIRLGGADALTIDRASRAAAQAGDLNLAARGWRKAIAAGIAEADWADLAEAMAEALPPERILDEVLAGSGRNAVRFAVARLDRPGDEATRVKFLRTALDRLPSEAGLSGAERRWESGRALAMLGDREAAREAFREAVESEPGRSDWRESYASWLIAWGEVEEAHRLARLGLALDPGRKGSRSTLVAAVEALAKAGRGR